MTEAGGDRVRSRNRDLWDKTFKDRDGEYVIYQTPNKWLIGWAVATFLSLITTNTISDVFAWIGIAFLAIWSYLEIAHGVNYFRRILGALVGLFAIATIVNLIR